MTEPYGLTSQEPFAYYDQESLCWRTSQPCLPLESLIESPMTWPKAGICSRGRAQELPMLAHRTDARDSLLSLPTPLSRDGKGTSFRPDDMTRLVNVVVSL